MKPDEFKLVQYVTRYAYTSCQVSWQVSSCKFWFWFMS